jgi:hypothetical protein
VCECDESCVEGSIHFGSWWSRTKYPGKGTKEKQEIQQWNYFLQCNTEYTPFASSLSEVTSKASQIESEAGHYGVKIKSYQAESHHFGINKFKLNPITLQTILKIYVNNIDFLWLVSAHITKVQRQHNQLSNYHGEGTTREYHMDWHQGELNCLVELRSLTIVTSSIVWDVHQSWILNCRMARRYCRIARRYPNGIQESNKDTILSLQSEYHVLQGR